MSMKYGPRTKMLINAFKRKFSTPSTDTSIPTRNVPRPYFEQPSKPTQYFRDLQRKTPKEGKSIEQRIREIQKDIERINKYA